MPSQIKNIKIFHHFYRLDFSTIKLVLCCVLNIFRTSSPLTSCYRLGPCLSTPSRSWWSWSLPALKNRPSVTTTWPNEVQIETIYQSPTNKDKIYLKQDRKLATICCCWQTGRNGATEHEGDRWRSGCVQRYKTRSGWSKCDVWTSGRSRSSGRNDVAQSRTTCNPC